MLMQVDISERAKVEATLAKLTESQVWWWMVGVLVWRVGTQV